MSDIPQIEKNVPLPANNREVKFPFAEMEVNDSFFVEGRTTKSFASITQHWRRKMNHRYATRNVEENGVKGVRVWRVE